MLANVLSIFVDLFVTVYSLLLIARVILSYVLRPENRFNMWLVSITDPLIAPVRRILPQTPGLDLAPLATYVLLRVLQYFVHVLLGT